MQAPELVLAIPVKQIAPNLITIENGQIHIENTYWQWIEKPANSDLVSLFDENVSHPISDSEMQNIKDHQKVIFIKGEVKHPKDLLVLIRFVDQILAENQTGVYVQNAGVCHSADFWNHLRTEDSLDAAIELFLGLHFGETYMLTQGMEILALPDLMVTSDDPEYARELLLSVCFDGIQEKSLKKNARILHGEDEQVYRLQEAKIQDFVSDAQNPFGLLRLVKSF